MVKPMTVEKFDKLRSQALQKRDASAAKAKKAAAVPRGRDASNALRPPAKPRASGKKR